MTAPNINTSHAFTTRHGGVSSGIYTSMNLGQNLGDDIKTVKRNYEILCETLNITPDDIIVSGQVHGTHIRVVKQDDRGKLFSSDASERIFADGMITNDNTLALMVYAGDCVPILLHDPIQGVIGAVHAGWRGTAADIAGAAIRKMQTEFSCSPAHIHAAIGPCISKCCFETDHDVADDLRNALGDDAESCITPQDLKYMIDLKEANRLLLTRSGISNISISNECTACLCDKYWSHRKTKGKRGSQAAIIMKGP